MEGRVIVNKVCVMNCPQDKEFGVGYMVVRLVDSMLWYYGFYDTMDRAVNIAVELGNGLVLGIDKKEAANG